MGLFLCMSTISGAVQKSPRSGPFIIIKLRHGVAHGGVVVHGSALGVQRVLHVAVKPAGPEAAVFGGDGGYIALAAIA